MDVLNNIEGNSFSYFDESDVVRHHLVQRIIVAYDSHKAASEAQLSLELGAKGNGEANGKGNGKAAAPEPAQEYRYEE